MSRGANAPGASPDESRFRALIENQVDGILVVSRDGTIRFANRAATRLLNRTTEELVGRSFGVPIIPGENTEIDLHLAGGEVRVAEMRVVPTTWEAGPALLASLRDISERKGLEDQLRQKVQELAEADRRKDEFLAMLAHELRNPLAPILNAAHALQLEPNDPDLHARLRALIEDQARCLARLVDDLLDTSRVRTGKLQLRPEVIELAGLMRRAVESTRSLYHAKHHHIHISLPDSSIRFQADPLRLEQALVNLLVNAAKYTDNGGEIRLEATVAEGQLSIRVSDDGIGIAPEMLPRIFDLFAQTDQAIDRSLGGLGIGLTLARSLVQLHGGTLTASSPGLGQGSEFVIALPLIEPAPSAGPREEKVIRPGRCLRLLLVDDHDQAVESLSMIMRLWGHDTRVATSGPEALAAARTYCPDVVILDIGLPGMDGFEVALELRKLSELGDVRLIALSGYSDEVTLRRSREVGFDHHLVKPADFDLLEELLANIDAGEFAPVESS